MVYSPRIDYSEEEVLTSIAKSWPDKVIELFGQRIEMQKVHESGHYEAIPFALSELATELSKHPALVAKAVFEWPSSREGLFEYLGGKLLANIFPSFAEPFREVLTDILNLKGDDGYTFVVGVLRAYDGEDFLFDFVKEILASRTLTDEVKRDCYLIISATGVTTGEFGYAEANEQKAEALEAWRDDDRDQVRAFAEEVIPQLLNVAKASRQRAEEEIALRKLEYGEPTGQA